MQLKYHFAPALSKYYWKRYNFLLVNFQVLVGTLKNMYFRLEAQAKPQSAQMRKTDKSCFTSPIALASLSTRVFGTWRTKKFGGARERGRATYSQIRLSLGYTLHGYLGAQVKKSHKSLTIFRKTSQGLFGWQ